MRTVDQDEPGHALGKPYRPAPAAPIEPKWVDVKGHPGYETDGKGVRIKQSTITIYDLYGMKPPAP